MNYIETYQQTTRIYSALRALHSALLATKSDDEAQGIINSIERLPGLPESMYDALQWLSDEAREREWERSLNTQEAAQEDRN